MSWPTPQPGLVVQFSCLWRHEAEAGREEGVKDRPCAVVIAVEHLERHPRVIVLPITHSPPHPPDEGVELPQKTKIRLGLDGERSWIVVSEGNDFVWPGPDLRFRPGHGLESAAYGFLPPIVFRAVRDRFLLRYHRRIASLVPRGE